MADEAIDGQGKTEGYVMVQVYRSTHMHLVITLAPAANVGVVTVAHTSSCRKLVKCVNARYGIVVIPLSAIPSANRFLGQDACPCSQTNHTA